MDIYKKMKIDMDKLVVINENEKIYTLDANTGKDLNENNSIITVIVIPIIIILLIALINKKESII